MLRLWYQIERQLTTVLRSALGVSAEDDPKEQQHEFVTPQDGDMPTNVDPQEPQNKIVIPQIGDGTAGVEQDGFVTPEVTTEVTSDKITDEIVVQIDAAKDVQHPPAIAAGGSNSNSDDGGIAGEIAQNGLNRSGTPKIPDTNYHKTLNLIVQLVKENQRQIRNLTIKQNQIKVEKTKPLIKSVKTFPPGNDIMNIENFTTGNSKNESKQDDSTGNSKNIADDSSLTHKMVDVLKMAVSNKDNLRRDYKLNAKTRFELFNEFFVSELRTLDLLYVVDKTVSPPPNLSQAMIEKHKVKVRDILINRIDPCYHSQIVQIQDPFEMYTQLKTYKHNEVNVTSLLIRKQLYSLTYNPSKETAIQFLNRFDELVRNYENIVGVDPLTETEKRDAIFGALTVNVPEVKTANFLSKQSTGKELGCEALKNFIMQEEASKKQATVNSLNGKDTTVASASYVKPASNDRCYICGDSGHMKNDCMNEGLIKCYECQKFTTHVANDCPQRLARLKASRGSFRGGSRGRGRGNNKYKYYKNNNNCSVSLHENNKRLFKNTNKRGGFGGHNQYTNKYKRKAYDDENGRQFNNQKKSNKQKHSNNNTNNNIPQANFAESSGEQSGMYNENKSMNGVSLSCEKQSQIASNDQSNDSMYVSFIVDTGATEHLINNKNIFETFEKGGLSTIKCANNDSKADLLAEGKGIVRLHKNELDKQSFELKNVIYSESLSENLLSIRHFAEAGFEIYLNNERVIIVNPKTGETFVTGVYCKPYWIIEFPVDKSKSLDPTAFDTTISSFESNKDNQNNPTTEVENKKDDELQKVSEGKINDGNSLMKETDEKLEEIIKELGKLSNPVPSKFDSTIVDRKITNVDELPEVDLTEEETPFDKNYSSFASSNKAMLWHVRMGHASLEYLRRLQKIWINNKKLQDVDFNDSIKDCEICALSKFKKLPFKNIRSRATRPLQVIHSDVMGKISPPTYPKGYQYIVVFVDDYSRLAQAYPMKTKDETGHCLENFIKSARNLLGKNEKICFLQTDQGSEYTGGYTTEVMKREGIEHKLACPDTPQHNGVSERFNQTIQNKVRSLMFDSRLPLNMWDLALSAAVYTYNRTPHKSNDFQTPLSLFAPNFSYDVNQIKRFGCMGYWKITRKPESKFSARAIRGVLVGYTISGYILLNPETGKLFQSRDLRFNEKLVYGDKFRKDSIQYWPLPTETIKINDWFTNFGKDTDESMDTRNLEGEKEQKKRGRPRKRLVETEGEIEGQFEKKTKVSREPYYTRSKIADSSFQTMTNLTNVTTNFEFPQIHEESEKVLESSSTDEILHGFFAHMNNDPLNFKQAVESENCNDWLSAIDDEINSMIKNKVWTEVERPKPDSEGRKPNIVDSKWVFKRKKQNDGTIKYKARLVSRGFKDKNTYDLKETYAPVSRLTLVRAVLAIINFYDLHAVQLDVKTAFLNGVIEKEVYMEIPQGVAASNERRRKYVYKLLKSLYGLRISPKQWNEIFTKVVKSLGFINDSNDPCLFILKEGNVRVILLIYVDDMLLASNDIEKLNEIKQKLMNKFEMTDLGEPNTFLGMNIKRNRETRTMSISQADYTYKILEKFGFNDVYPKGTPMITRQASNKERKEREEKESEKETTVTIKAPYREMVGSLLYLAGSTRPDISYAVNVLSRHQINPTENEYKMIQRVFEYLKGTITMGLLYLGRRQDMLAYSDSSFADCKESKSTCGYIIQLFGDTVAWRTMKQNYVALSTCEAEYIAMSEACREVVSINRSISRPLEKSFFPVVIKCDNMAAMVSANSNGNNKLRHMTEIRQDYIKECIDENRIITEWVSSKDQLADIMTKPLPFETHVKLRNKIMNNFYTE